MVNDAFGDGASHQKMFIDECLGCKELRKTVNRLIYKIKRLEKRGAAQSQTKVSYGRKKANDNGNVTNENKGD